MYFSFIYNRRKTLLEKPLAQCDMLYYTIGIEFVICSLKGLIVMKSRILSSIAVVALIAFALLLIVGTITYPMHLGEPSYYHVARVNCLAAATACALVAIVSAITSAHF